jgi:hypothetical protein
VDIGSGTALEDAESIEGGAVGERIILLAESDCLLLDDKLIIYNLSTRPTFMDFIKIANKYDGIKIIANADIYFNLTLAKLQNLDENLVYCLTRWDLLSNGKIKFYENFKSQDSWIFKNKIPEHIGQYFMGTPGCDNRFAYELKEVGFKLKNPSLSIQSVHLHLSNIRTYDKGLDRVKGKYYYPLPNTIKSESFTIKTRTIYWAQSRKYYEGIWRKTIEGYSVNIFVRILSILKSFYFKCLLKFNK